MRLIAITYLMDDMNLKLEDVPKIKVLGREGDRLKCVYEPSPYIGGNQCGVIITPDETFVWGRVRH